MPPKLAVELSTTMSRRPSALAARVAHADHDAQMPNSEVVDAVVPPIPKDRSSA
jgi:hypothetical protein